MSAPHRRRGRTGRKPRFTERDAEIVAMYKAGHSRKVIAKKYGISTNSVGQIVNRAGVTHDSEGNIKALKSPVRDEPNTTASALLSRRWS